MTEVSLNFARRLTNQYWARSFLERAGISQVITFKTVLKTSWKWTSPLYSFYSSYIILHQEHKFFSEFLQQFYNCSYHINVPKIYFFSSLVNRFALFIVLGHVINKSFFFQYSNLVILRLLNRCKERYRTGIKNWNLIY